MTNHPNTEKNRKDSLSNPDGHFTLGVLFFGCPSFSGFEPAPAFISPGGNEFLLIMLVLILLFGAKDAPRIFRSLHNTFDKMQRAAASFRYKIMYGDLYQDQNTSTEEPYDVDAHSSDEDEDERSEFDTQSSEEEPEQPEEETDQPKQKPEPSGPGTGNVEPKA